jgi:hypothetical protein
MSEAFRASFDRLLTTAQRETTEALDQEETRFYEQLEHAPPPAVNEAEFVAVPAPTVLTQPVTTVGDLVSQIRRVDRRWRLDALVALDDYVS